MAGTNELPHMHGYITIKEAADLIGISTTRIYDLIDDGRLKAVKFGGGTAIEKKSAEAFTRKAPGRTRTKGPPWHKYSTPTKLQATEISVKIREGQERRLLEKLEAIREDQRHTLKGSVA